MSIASDHGGIRVIAPIPGPSPYQFQVYYNDGYTHYSDAAGNEVGPGASGGGTPVQQAPGVVATAMAVPESAGGSVGVNIPSGLSQSSTINFLGPPQTEGSPAFLGPPQSAVLVLDQRGTTSQQSGDNPGPTPAVGVIAPQAAGAQPPTMSVSPGAKSSWKSLAVIFGAIIALWFFTGWSFGRRLL